MTIKKQVMQAIKYLLLLSLWWTPRILCILLALFLSFFSFDVFGLGTKAWETALAFLMHNIPTIIIVLVLIFSWKRSWLGAISYTIIGIVFYFLMPGRSTSLILVLPIIAIGVLYYLNWLFRAEIIKAKKAYAGEEQ